MSAPSRTAPASSNDIPAGLRATAARSRMHVYSACAPKYCTPNTSSPSSNSVTAGPTASTTPASSMPRTRRFGRRRPMK